MKPGIPFLTKRLKWIADIRPSGVDKHSVEGEPEVRLCNYTDVYKHDRITDDMAFMVATATQDQVERFSLIPGDVIITKDSETPDDIAVPALVAEPLENVVCGYHLTLLRPKPGTVGSFLFWCLKAAEVSSQMSLAAQGVTRFGITTGATGRVLLPHPDEENQRLIADFLDRETAKLDDLVAEQETLLTLLEEKRAATIAHAVTKGLDPNAPMKDSGVEWLGPVPASWSVFPLKRVVHGMCDGPFGSGLKSEHYVAEGARVVRLQNIRAGWFDASDTACVDEAYFRAELSGHEVLADDVLVAGLGDERNLVGRACVAPDDLGSALVKADCFRLRLNREIALPAFIAAQLTVGAPFAAGTLSNGSTRARIPLSVNATRRIALPATVEEQKTIIERMGQMTAAFAALGAEARTNIALLRERRAALISAAVTGRIDVRGTVAAPDKVELAA